MRRKAPDSSLHVLVVDNSADGRREARAVLDREKDMRVTTAVSALAAIESIRLDRPQVVLMDLDSTGVDGLSFLRAVMATGPLPVIVGSKFSPEGSARAMEAMDQGALDVVATPWSVFAREEHHGAHLGDLVRSAATARLRPHPGQELGDLSGIGRIAGRLPARAATRIDPVIAMGASMGGPYALASLVSALPSDLPGIVAVQHGPGALIQALAARLDGIGAIRVMRAESGAPIIRGQMLLAADDHCLAVRRSGPGFVVARGPESGALRRSSSIDTLFHSVASEAGANAVGLILSGIGQDGADGLLKMKRAGALTIAQDEASSVVYGMPRAAVALGATSESIALAAIPAAIILRVSDILVRANGYDR